MDDYRAFPQAIEAERALLGGLIERPDLIQDVVGVVDADDFYRADHAELFRMLLKMDADGEQIDLVTVADRVGRADGGEKYGGVAYVAELPEQAPATANLAHYAKLIRQKSLLRTLIQTSQGLAHEAYQQPDDVKELLDRASQQIIDLGRGGARADWHPVSMILDEELVRLEEMGDQPDGVTGVPTGFLDLDQKLAGMQDGDLVILAARPSMGKTALALNIAQNAALMGGVGVGIYSLEMSRQQLVDRMLCTYAQVDASKVRTGRLDVDDWERFLEASEVLRQVPVFINDKPGLTISQVRAHARRLALREESLGLIVLDYLQLMSADDPRQSRVQQVSEMSRGLKALAKDLEVPVLALSQLSRGVESRQDKRPIMSDLRESGAIEQDADVVMFIYRDEYYNPDTVDQGLAEVIIAKQRNGPTGTVRLVFQGRYTRFDNYADDALTL